MSTKPILFNTKMVQAIQKGEKTVTRRLVKQFVPEDAQWGYSMFTPGGHIGCRGTFPDGYGEKFVKLPFRVGDILYVREAWLDPCTECPPNTVCYGCVYERGYRYRADYADPSVEKWRPSIHMPRDAARIWLRVTEVSVFRLQDITKDQAKNEGAYGLNDFRGVWDSTVSPADIPAYGWDANPWVFAISFSRCEKPKGGNKS